MFGRLERQNKNRKKVFEDVIYKTSNAGFESINTDDETAQLRFRGTPNPRTNLRHPYAGPNSWMRVMPERGTKVTLTYNASTNQQEVISYFNNNPQELIQGFANENSLYRVMEPGEFDTVSSGLATMYWGARGTLELRGGAVHGHLSQDELETSFSAPTHVKRMHQNLHSQIGDEQRVGVVKRPTDNGYDKYVKVDDENFAKESLLNLKTTDNVDLVDIRMGHVTDDNGNFQESQSGENVRVLARFLTTGDSEATLELDEAGNLFLNLPDDATEGFDVDIPKGNIKVRLGKDFNMDAKGKATVIAQKGIDLGSGLVPLTQLDGVVTGMSICHFTGAPHSDVSSHVRCSKTGG